MKLSATPGGPLTGEADIPGDKSCSHRALILGAMAEGETHITGLLESDDVLATVNAIRQFGGTADCKGGVWSIRGGEWEPRCAIDCGNSGTTARLLIGAVAGRPGMRVLFSGDASLSARPMQRVTLPLSRMGASFESSGGGLPLTVKGGQLGGIEHRNVPASAQVKSAILLAGLGTTAPVRVIEPLPSRDHTEIMLGQFGCRVELDDTPEGWAVSLGKERSLAGCEIAIAADPSSAAFPLVAAAIVPGSEAQVRGMLVNPLRTGLYEVLEQMGADIAVSNERIQSGEIIADVQVRHAALAPCRVAASQIPAMVDEIPALAIACAFADGESVIEGLGELRVKESDRLGAIVAGLAACGVTAVTDDDALRIFGRGEVRGGASIATLGDHRIAMAFLMLGLGAEQPVEVDESEMIATSFPGFAEVMRSLGADIK